MSWWSTPRPRESPTASPICSSPAAPTPRRSRNCWPSSPKAELDQKNCEFVPYAQAIHQDQPLVIKSSDPVNHNVRYAAFTNPSFNQILAPNGQLEVKLVAERRPIAVACDIHSWMKAWIMVFDHPFFAVTGPDGSFEIKGVPAGEQHLVVWQEKVGYVNPEKARGTPGHGQGGRGHGRRRHHPRPFAGEVSLSSFTLDRSGPQPGLDLVPSRQSLAVRSHVRVTGSAVSSRFWA